MSARSEPKYRVLCGDGRDRCQGTWPTRAEAEAVAWQLDRDGLELGPHAVERVS